MKVRWASSREVGWIALADMIVKGVGVVCVVRLQFWDSLRFDVCVSILLAYAAPHLSLQQAPAVRT